MPKRVSLVCGCGRVIETCEYPDNNREFTYIERLGECEPCSKSTEGYHKSTCWKEPKKAPPLKTSVRQDDFKGDDKPEKPQPPHKRTRR